MKPAPADAELAVVAHRLEFAIGPVLLHLLAGGADGQGGPSRPRCRYPPGSAPACRPPPPGRRRSSYISTKGLTKRVDSWVSSLHRGHATGLLLGCNRVLSHGCRLLAGLVGSGVRVGGDQATATEEILRGLAASAFGELMRRMPLRYSALTRASSTSVGNAIVRMNLPEARSLR